MTADKPDAMPVGPFQLRRAIPADAQAFFELDQLCFVAAIAYSLEEFRSLLRSRTVISAVAEFEGQPAGFALAQQRSLRGVRGGHIVTIDVAPLHRRRGIGRLLMADLERGVQASGGRWIRLEVAADNPTAQAFYAGLGFAPLGQIQDYYCDGLDAVVMEKRLGDPGISSSAGDL